LTAANASSRSALTPGLVRVVRSLAARGRRAVVDRLFGSKPSTGRAGMSVVFHD